MAKYLDKLADHITVTTDALKESLTKFVSPNKITVIPNMLPRYKWNYNRNTKPTTESKKEDTQKKESDDLDFSSIFYLSFFVALLCYVTLFFAAPFIANFYKIY